MSPSSIAGVRPCDRCVQIESAKKKADEGRGFLRPDCVLCSPGACGTLGAPAPHASVGYMPGQFGFGLLCDGVVDELPGVVLLGVVVLGVVEGPVELAAFAIAAPPPARIPALPRVRRAARIRFMVSPPPSVLLQGNPTSMRTSCGEPKNCRTGRDRETWSARV